MKAFNHALLSLVVIFCVASTLYVLNELGQSQAVILQVVSR